jgi:hypothetical protein
MATGITMLAKTEPALPSGLLAAVAVDAGFGAFVLTAFFLSIVVVI